MERTEATLRRLFAALDSPAYDIAVLSDGRMYPRLEDLPPSHILHMLPYLKHRNAAGGNIYFRPSGESRFTLLDDLTAETLPRLTAEGFTPCAVIETSPGNYQAWLRHVQPLPKELGTLAAKVLAVRFNADPGAADWRRFGRLPGFTNRKPKHRNDAGFYPFTRLTGSRGQLFPQAQAFHEELIALSVRLEAERLQSRSRYAARPLRPSASLTLARFRNASKYEGRPAAADLAFAILACAHGWSEDDIAAELAANYLSRDQNLRRREAYIRRTLAKAIRWAK